MTYSNRIFLYGPVAAMLALAVAVSAYWFSASAVFARKLDALNGHQIAPGVTLHFERKRISGFPFRIDAELDGMTLTAATSRGPITWESTHFVLHSLDYGGLHVVAEAAGRQSLTWNGGSAARRIAFTPVLLRASALGSGGAVQRLDVELYGAADPSFTARHAEFHLRRDPAHDVLDLVVMADGLRYAPAQGKPAELVLAHLQMSGRIAPGDSWHDLLSGRATWPGAVDRFRKAGGVLDIDALSVAWGDLTADGRGVVGLDGLARPQGMLALTAAHGRDPRTHALTLAFKDGIAYVGDVPAGFLSPLD